MTRPRTDFGQWKLFAALAGLGLVAQMHHVHIPHTDVLIDGRWAFGFMGFALLRRRWMALLLAACLATPWGTDIPFAVGFFGNLAYALPAMLLIRGVHPIALKRLGTGWPYGLVWFAVVLLCYQAFTTPVVWGVLGVLEGTAVWAKVLEGWRVQPFLVESVLVAAFSATGMMAYLSHMRLRADQRRLEHLNRLLLGIRNINQFIIAEDDPHRLIEKACTNLTETVGYLGAWIALLGERASLADMASSRLGEQAGALRSRLAGGSWPDGMRRAIHCDQTVVVADGPALVEGLPVAEAEADMAGFFHRLRHGERTYGVLAVAVPFPYAEQEHEQELFDEVAGDLAFALHKIEAARELQENRTMLQRTEAIAQVGSWQWDARQDRVQWSAELFRLFGRDPEDGAPSFEEHDSLYVAEDMTRLREAVSACLREGKPYELELCAIRTDGERRICVARGRPLPEPDGSIHRLVGSLQDITDRKQAEWALQESETRYRGLFESAKDGILILEGDTGKVVDVNPFLAELLGCEPDSLLGRPLWDIGPFGAIARSGEDFQRLQDRGYVRYEDVPLETADGRRVEVEFVSNVYLVNQARVIQCHIRDITPRKALESQLAQAQKMEAVGRLAGGVAHDFNNMLQTILGYSDMLLAEAGADHPFREHLQEIRQAGARSAELTRQLLAFARKQTVAPVVLDLNAAVTDMLKMLERLIGEDIDLLWQPCRDMPLVNMDPAQVDQILANLVVNSRDAITGSGRVTIETGEAEFDEETCRTRQGFRPGRYVMLAVSDDGEGMDPQTRDQVFEPFFTTKDKEKGTGLGLATVYGIVKQNDGFINIYSEPGEGTTIRIYLPAALEGGRCRPRTKTDDDLPTGSETVLLVEDEPSLLTLSRRVLENLGYTVLAASGPREALDLAEESGVAFDALITDVVMPEMSGKELQERLAERRGGLRCLYMSGYTENVIAHHGVLEDGVHFLQKPFSTADLARKLREVLATAPGRGEAAEA